jgi:hypothetical protein
MTSKETIQILLAKAEKDRLDFYCQKNGRSITDVLREFIRSLPES